MKYSAKIITVRFDEWALLVFIQQFTTLITSKFLYTWFERAMARFIAARWLLVILPVMLRSI